MTDIIPVATIADLEAYNLNRVLEGQAFYVASFNAAVNGVTDGGGGFFLLTYHVPPGAAGAPTGVNSFTIFASNTAGAYFYRQFQGPYLIEWSGLDQTGATDAVPGLTVAVNATPDGSELTTYRSPTLAINSEFKINNRTSLTLSCSGVMNNAGGKGAIMVFGGTAGANVIELINCGYCVIKGWQITLNHAGRGVVIGTEAGTATRISTSDVLKDLLIWQNLKTTDLLSFVSVAVTPFNGSNNEFMQFDNISCQGAYNNDIANGVSNGFQFGGDSNNHYHVMRNCRVLGAKVGINAPWGAVRCEGMTDISFCQIAITTDPANTGYTMDVNFLDCESNWSIVANSGGVPLKFSNCRFASCGTTGKALFDYTNGRAPPMVVQQCQIDLAVVISSGGYLIDATGLTGGFPQIWRSNNYNQNAANAPGLLNGVTLNQASNTGFVIYAERDAIVSGTSYDMGEGPFFPQEYSSISGGLLGVGGGNQLSVAAGAITFSAGGSYLLVRPGDASTLITITLGVHAPAHPVVFLRASGGSVVIGNTGNIAYSGTLTDGQMILLMYDGTKWQRPN